MKKISLFACVGILVLSASCTVTGQNETSASMYVDYNEYVSALEKFIRSGKRELWSASMKKLQESAVPLKEEIRPAQNIRTTAGNGKTLSDEEVYARRSNSVLMIGRLRNGQNTTDILFEILGTAFAISDDGTCVTNYHVLQNIMLSKEKDKDVIYFVIAANKKLYLLDQVLAYSQNNDLTVFKVNTEGDKFSPIPLGKPAQVGATVYCISNPAGQMLFYSKGIVARNVLTDSASISSGYSRSGRPPIRMEITAEYGAGSSGGPVLDKSGNVVGIIASTNTVFLQQLDKDGRAIMHPQMVLRSTAPVKALTDLIQD